MHRTTARFWTCFARLPETDQRAARQNFALLKENPAHPSLHFQKIGKVSREMQQHWLWSVRVGINHRILGVEDGTDFIWVWIGPHDEYT